MIEDRLSHTQAIRVEALSKAIESVHANELDISKGDTIVSRAAEFEKFIKGGNGPENL